MITQWKKYNYNVISVHDEKDHVFVQLIQEKRILQGIKILGRKITFKVIYTERKGIGCWKDKPQGDWRRVIQSSRKNVRLASKIKNKYLLKFLTTEIAL